jgi:hypothetical protein
MTRVRPIQTHFFDFLRPLLPFVAIVLFR